MVIILRDSLAQIPHTGSLEDAPENWTAPEDAPPSEQSLEQWINSIRLVLDLRPQDAAIVVPFSSEVDVNKARSRWSDTDKSLWISQIEMIVNQHYEFLLGQTLAKKQRIDAVEQERKRRERMEVLSRLQSKLADLRNGVDRTPQQRGKVFEDWLGELFQLYELSPTIDIVNQGEQIDFTFWKGDLFVVGEARWRVTNVDSPQVRDFFGKLMERPAFSVGLIISMSEFTTPALDYIRRHSGERTVLTLSSDYLDQILRAEPEFPEWLGQSLRARLEDPHQ